MARHISDSKALLKTLAATTLLVAAAVSAGCAVTGRGRYVSTAHFLTPPAAEIRGAKLLLTLPTPDIPTAYGVRPEVRKDKSAVLVRGYFSASPSTRDVWEFDLSKYGFTAASAASAEVYWLEPTGGRTKLEVTKPGVVAATKANAAQPCPITPVSRAKVTAMLARAGGRMVSEEDLAYLSNALSIRLAPDEKPSVLAEAIQLDNLRITGEEITAAANGPLFKYVANLQWKGCAAEYVISWEGDFATARPAVFFSDEVYGAYLESLPRNFQAAFGSRGAALEHLQTIEAFAAFAAGSAKDRAGRWAAEIRQALEAPKPASTAGSSPAEKPPAAAALPAAGPSSGQEGAQPSGAPAAHPPAEKTLVPADE